MLLNAEWDHPDVFADEEAVLTAFEAWIRTRQPDATLVANTRDPGVAHDRRSGSAGRLAGHDRCDADDEPASFQIGLPGPANAANAMAVVAAARVLGIDESVVRESLAAFRGVGRRLELKGEIGGVVVLDDYGHHPTAIARTLEAVRGQYPGRPVWAVYEPLTYHRTAAMLDGSPTCWPTADHVAIADIWAGRDPDTTITSAAGAGRRGHRARRPAGTAMAPGTVEETADYLAAQRATRRRRAGHGRRPVVRHRRAPGGAAAQAEPAASA